MKTRVITTEQEFLSLRDVWRKVDSGLIRDYVRKNRGAEKTVEIFEVPDAGRVAESRSR